MTTEKQHPGISVILPTSQSEQTLEACLESVAAQNYPDLELLIIDKLSTDSTLEIATRFAERYPWVTLVSEVDKGIFDAMNKGVNLARGEWLYFLGSDDVLEPEAFTRLFNLIDERHFDFVYGDVRLRSGQLFDGEFSTLAISRRNLCHQAAFYRRGLFERFGRFETRFPVWGDWEFNWRCFGDVETRRTWVPTVVAGFGSNGFSSTQDDEVLLSERPKLLFKHFKGCLSGDQMHEMLWHLLPRYVEEDFVRGLALMVRVGWFTRRLHRYVTVAVFWRMRSIFGSTRALRHP
ncbi:MAG: glycosyltransferase family 2 protein [Acidobacteriota bacterium]